MKRAKGGTGNSIEMTIKFWWDKDDGHIHLRGEGSPASFVSTVSADPKSKRGNPNLYWKLAERLRIAGAPAPQPEEAD